MSIMNRLMPVWLVVVAAVMGAAIELYDEPAPGDMELMYQDRNYIDTGPVEQETKYEDPMKNIFLNRMINSLRNRDTSPSILSGPKWIPSDPVLVPPDFFFSHMKGPIIKRLSDLKIVPKDVKPTQRLQQKWKIKKGRSGSQMICYFKLCAFRSPV